jgi:hypothetical protein
MTAQMQGFPSSSFIIASCEWNKSTQQIDYTLTISATGTSEDRMDGWTLYTKLSTESESDWIPYDNVLRTNEDGLTQSISLDSSYPVFALINVKFVATRSLYLDSSNYDNQVETVEGLLGAVDAETTQISKVPDVLPPPESQDIVLSDIIYDLLGPENQNATLSVTLPDNAVATRITEPDDTEHTSTSSTYNFSIDLTSTPTALSYLVEYKYDSYVNGVLTAIYSAQVAVSFSTGTSDRAAPVIVSKHYTVGTDSFAIVYTSANEGTPNSVVTSTMFVASGADAPINLGTDDGAVTISDFQGLQVNLNVEDSFESTYTVGGSSATTTQIINSPNVSFYLAANPKINEDSIEVTAGTKFVFQMYNNGCPFIDKVLVVGVQDSGINEADQGTYQLAMFENVAGFALSTPYSNNLNGGELHTLSVTDITGSGMGVVTSFEITFTGSFNANPANILIYGSNAVEGADSFTAPNVSAEYL